MVTLKHTNTALANHFSFLNSVRAGTTGFLSTCSSPGRFTASPRALCRRISTTNASNVNVEIPVAVKKYQNADLDAFSEGTTALDSPSASGTDRTDMISGLGH
jgi:hypothetical protein